MDRPVCELQARIEANFYNRMRTGEIPIGIADYYNYVLLSTAAPELTGWWRMVPLPGVRRPDGTIDRSAGGTSTATVDLQRLKETGGRMAARQVVDQHRGPDPLRRGA